LKVRIRNGLLLNLVGLGVMVFVLFLPSSTLQVVLGLPFLLFFPGYALLLPLFPKRESINGTERVALSLALSIVVIPLLGFILNYTPWGIRTEPIVFSSVLLIFICSIGGWLRTARLAKQERFSIEFQLKVPGWGVNTLERVLYVILVIVILGTLGTLGYVFAKPRVGETFTEFYILDSEGKATAYPRQLKAGEEETILIGIINREHEMVTYWIEIKPEGVVSSKLGPIVLEHNERSEQPAIFTLDKPGEEQKVDFLLYKQGQSEVYQALSLWVDVRE